MKKRLPIGIQSFEKLRTENCYYVDKTYFVKKLVDEGWLYFLSRPRRFGKSLFLDTLKQAFLGKKELFEGLYVERNWNWSQSYPVIHISFGEGVIESPEILDKTIASLLKRQATEHEINLEEEL
ncbi:MAG: AAA family ATPase, partial [Nitrososphaerales archaeon]